MKGRKRNAGLFVLLTSNWEMAQAESKREDFLGEQDRRKSICSLRVNSCKENIQKNIRS